MLDAVVSFPGTWLPMNLLVFSRHGALNTEMARDKYLDGDLVQAPWLHCCCVSSRVRGIMSLSCQRKDAGISCLLSDCDVDTADSISSRDRDGCKGGTMLACAVSKRQCANTQGQ